MISKIFKFDELETNLSRETIAGLTTFITMAYIIFVNPFILSNAGMPESGVLFATCISAALASLIMGLWTNYPFALAPGMGLNAYFVSVCQSMNISWEVTLGLVFISGVSCLLLTITKIRTIILKAIPDTLVYATSVGIGLFIAFIGFQYAKIIIFDKVTFVTLGNLLNKETFLAIFGLFLTSAFIVRRVKGAIFLGIIVTTGLAICMGVTHFPSSLIKIPNWKSTFLKLDIISALKLGFLNIIFVFLFVDLFDTIGTLAGVSAQGNFYKDGDLPRSGRAFISDASGTIIGSLFGTSTVTSYIESAAGVAVGGRSGFVSIVVAFLFLVSIFFSPLVGIVPQAATAPALILVGSFMMQNISKIFWNDPSEGIPAFLTIVTMPLTYSIANGLSIGFISYTLIKFFSGEGYSVHWLVYLLSFLFILKFIFSGT